MHYSPSLYVTLQFGGVRQTARHIKRNPSNVCRWSKPKSKGGLSGRIPSSAMRVILKAARRLDLDITAEDLIFGREVRVRQ